MGHEKEIITAYQILLTSLSFKKNFTFHFDNINNNNNNNDNDKKINNNEYNSNWKKQRVEQLGGISNLHKDSNVTLVHLRDLVHGPSVERPNCCAK